MKVDEEEEMIDTEEVDIEFEDDKPEDDKPDDEKSEDAKSEDAKSEDAKSKDDEIRAAVAAAIAAKEKEWRDAQARERTSDADEGGMTSEEEEELRNLAVADFGAYTKRMLEIAEERALKRARAEYGGVAQEAVARKVASKLADGLGDKGREYVTRYAAMITEENADNPEVQDLVRRAAKDYEREHVVKREKVERTHSESPTISDADRQGADFFAKVAARAAGVDYEKLRLTDKELSEARRRV